MGGKGGSSPPSIDPNMVSNMQMQNTQMLTAFKDQMSQIMSQSALPTPAVTAAPATTSVSAVDWKAKIDELNENAVNLTQADQDKRKSLADTILTSSLLEDEEATSKQFYALGQ